MTGPGIWLRIKHRFGPRMTEWVVAVQTMLWGMVVLSPQFSFDGPAWTFFRGTMDEVGLGYLMFAIGLGRLCALLINGSLRRVTPIFRVASAALGCMVWTGISYSFAQSGVISTWIAIYPVIACVELINIYRAAHDVGESYGTA
jgi:hypothetical protein